MANKTIERRVRNDSNKIRKFKNVYLGKRCFIIGNGPSLCMKDLDVLSENNEYSFGSNGIHLAFNQTKWRPTFYTLCDCKALSEWYDDISRIDAQYKFISDLAYASYNLPLHKGVNVFRLIEKKHYPFCPDFSPDVSQFIGNSYTVTYISMQIAAYMGFSAIYLLGMDHNYSKHKDENGNVVKSDAKDYFIENYSPSNKTGMSRLYLCDKAFSKTEIYSRFHGFRVYNATRGGKLEVFERINFDNIKFQQEWGFMHE